MSLNVEGEEFVLLNHGRSGTQIARVVGREKDGAGDDVWRLTRWNDRAGRWSLERRFLAVELRGSPQPGDLRVERALAKLRRAGGAS